MIHNHIDIYIPHLKEKIDHIFQIIHSHSSFLLLGHKNPDGDCVGSLLGFGKWLENQGKQVYYYTPTLVEGFDRVSGVHRIQTRDGKEDFEFPDTDVIITLDFSTPNRWEDKQRILELLTKKKPSICIDHHVSPDGLTENDIIDTGSTSCCELLRELMTYRGEEFVDNDIATYCYMGLVTDTSELFPTGFQFIRNKERIFENARDMAKFDIDISYITDQLSKTSLQQIQFLQLSLSRLKTHNHNIIRTRHTLEECYKYGIKKAQSGLGIQIARTIEGYNIFIGFTKDGSYRRCSMRSKGGYDVGNIARHFGGGGHRNAAACSFNNPDRTEPDLEHLVQQIDDLIGKTA